MSDASPTAFTTEEITEHAQTNLTAIILTTFAYLQDHALSRDEYVQYVGHRLAPGWEEVKDHPLPDITRLAALYMVSSGPGARLRSLSGDETQAEAVVTGWPTEEWCSFIGVTLEDLDPFWNIYQPIAAHLGLRYSWERHGDALTLRFTRAREA